MPPNMSTTTPVDSSKQRFRRAGVAPAAASNAPSALTIESLTPRKYIKALQSVLALIFPHKATVNKDTLEALQALQTAVRSATLLHGKTVAGSKLFNFLTEDGVVQQLQGAAATLVRNLRTPSTLEYLSVQAKSDLKLAGQKLQGIKCELPEYQMQMIRDFRQLGQEADVNLKVPEAIQERADKLMRDVVKEVYGVMFNDQALDQELDQLMLEAQQPQNASSKLQLACINLIAKSLKSLEVEDDGADDGLGGAGQEDCFTLPAFRGEALTSMEGGNGPVEMNIVLEPEEGTPDQGPVPVEQVVDLSSSTMTEPATSSSLIDPAVAAQALAAIRIAEARRSSAGGAGTRATTAAIPAAEGFGSYSAAYRSSGEFARADPASATASSSRNVSGNGVAGGAADSAAAVGAVGEAKTQKFVDFLDTNCNNEKRSAMFHAQMKLSIEGMKRLAAFLRTNHRVKALTLSHNHVGDEGVAILAEAIKDNNTLQTLELPDNNIGDAGAQALAEALASNTSLLVLQLSHNSIGDKGATALAKALHRNTTLQKLGLHNNCIGSTGCAALATMLHRNETLKSLEFLPGNFAAEREVKALAKAIKHNKKFTLKGLLSRMQQPEGSSLP